MDKRDKRKEQHGAEQGGKGEHVGPIDTVKAGGERYLTVYKLPECGQRCARAFQDGVNFRVTSVEVYLLHNGVVAGRSGPIDQGNMNLADYRSDLSDAAEEAILDAKMEDLEPNDNFSPSPLDVFGELTHDLSSVFPEVDREEGRISTLLVYERKCPAGCTCVWEGEPAASRPESRRTRTLTFQRVVPVGNDGEYTYQIVWTVTFEGWDQRWQFGTCKHFL